MATPLSVSDLEALVTERPCLGSADPRRYSDVGNRMPRVVGPVAEWFRAALRDERKKWPAAALLTLSPAHAKPLVRELISAALVELDPSYNRAFVRALRGATDWASAVDVLLELADRGGPLERGGVGRMAYWLQIDLPNPDEASLVRLRTWILEEFVRSSDVIVLRCLIGVLDLAVDHYPEPVRCSVPIAIEKARNHPDEYVRQRLAIQLGEASGPFPMLVTNTV